MPILLEPDQTFLVCLDVDNDKPEAQRPMFIVKAQSMRGQLRILRVIDRIHEESIEIGELFDATVEELKRVIVGWKNFNKQFDASNLDDSLTFNEARELLVKVAYNQRMSADEKKV